MNLYNNNYTEYYGLCAATSGCTERLNSSDNIDQDPLFVTVSDPDPYNWDLHITSNSPCHNSGHDSAPSLPSIDYDGDSRSEGSAPDMGADEIGGSDEGGCFITNAAR